MAQSSRDYGKYLQLHTFQVFGGVSINPQISNLRSGCDVLVATPGRLLDLAQQRAVDLTGKTEGDAIAARRHRRRRRYRGRSRDARPGRGIRRQHGAAWQIKHLRRQPRLGNRRYEFGPWFWLGRVHPTPQYRIDQGRRNGTTRFLA